MITEVVTALADQLAENITMEPGVELHVEPIPFPIAEAPNINMIVGFATGLEETLGGFGQRIGGIPIAITFRVPSVDIYAAMDMAYGFMDSDGPLSILAAIDADRTLGGIVDTIGWNAGWPWIGPVDFPTIDDNGILLGSRMEIVVAEKGS